MSLICKYCGREFKRPCGLAVHERTCKGNPDRRELENHVCGYAIHMKKSGADTRKDTTVYRCRFCGKECVGNNSLRNHERLCRENPDRQTIDHNNFENYNKEVRLGLRKGSNQYVKAKESGLPKPEVSEKTRMKLSALAKNRRHSEETRCKISERMKNAAENNPEHYSKCHNRRGFKHEWYNGYYLDSSWELDVAKYLDRNNILWEKPRNGFRYEMDGEEHLYYPDFHLIEYDRYIEVKGFERDKDLIKYRTIENLILIREKEINMIREGGYDIFKILGRIPSVL